MISVCKELLIATGSRYENEQLLEPPALMRDFCDYLGVTSREIQRYSLWTVSVSEHPYIVSANIINDANRSIGKLLVFLLYSTRTPSYWEEKYADR